MAFHKMTRVFLVASLISITAADYHYQNYKVYNFDGDQAEPYRKPWFFDDYSSPFKNPKSGGFAQSENAYESVAEQKTPEVYENPAESYFVASIKKVPNEDKNFKKAISPFYTLTATDNEKYKSIVLKSGAPYCQEIKNPVPKKRFRRDAMTCYKCKDPKNGATYEQCSYTSASEPQETVLHKEYVPLAASLRYRRSNANRDAVKTGVENADYRFGEEYFTPPVVAAEDTAESKKSPEKCEKVIKDSMICMVCTNPETHGKYEQCSYSNQPDDKSYAYSKSSSFGLPHTEKNPAESRNHEKSTERSYAPGEEAQSGEEHPELDKYFEEQTARIKARTPKRKKHARFEPSAELESGSENVKDGKCEKITKDDMVCLVCKDPETGGKYEQCSYAHKPSDKVYQVSKSKSFGYPEAGKGAGETGKPASYETGSYYGGAGGGAGESGEKYDYDQPSEKQETQEYVPYKFEEDGASAEYVKSESERISEEVKDGDCKTVKKESMTCRVCKDPKTGGNSEQCSYAYEPNDKLFSFSRAKSFGSPEEGGRAEDSGSSGESYTDRGSYGLASDNKPYVAGEETSASNKKNEESAGAKDAGNLGNVEFFNTAEKKKEIEKVLSEFQREDRSKCKKVIREKLTCFVCTDKDGAQKEECIFVAAQEPAKDRVAYREVKEYQREPKSAEAFVKPVVNERKERKTRKVIPARYYAEPILAASEEREEAREAEEVEGNGDADKENVEAADTEYDYAAATQPIYDKVLGLTLPRYMLTTSEHEAEFDEVVASSRV